MGAKFTPAERRAHILTVEEQYLSGHSQADIGKQIGVSQQQIGKYLRNLQAAWQARLGENLEAAKARELSRLDRLEREHWRAWERSQLDAQTTSQRSVAGVITAEVTKRGQVGDARFLQGVMQCIEMRLKIIGGFAPAKVDIAWKEALDKHGVDASTIFEELVQSAVERAAAAASGGSAGDGQAEARESGE